MSASDEIKRINFNIPRELYDRFIEASQKEYMTTSSVMTGWITNYVKEKERERFAEERKALQATLRTLSKLLYAYAQAGQDRDSSCRNIAELSEMLLSLSSQPALCLSVDLQAKLARLERELEAGSQSKTGL
jgi:hypothetical protein